MVRLGAKDREGRPPAAQAARRISPEDSEFVGPSPADHRMIMPVRFLCCRPPTLRPRGTGLDGPVRRFG